MNAPAASIIVLNYNGKQFLEELTKSLNQQKFKDFEVIFVDNASVDGSIDFFSEEAEHLKLNYTIVRNNGNLGYCQAMNNGALVSKGNYLIFLTNDIYVSKNWLTELIKMSSRKNVGAVASKIMYYSDKDRIDGAGAYCDVYGGTIGRGNGEIDNKQYDNADFFYASGGAILIKRNVFEEIGQFDPKIFMYHDDVDICWRIRLLGYDIKIAPKAVCYHVRTQDEVKQIGIIPPLKFYHAHALNRVRVMLKCYSLTNLARFLAPSLAIISARAFYSSFKTGQIDYIKYLFKGLFQNIMNLRDTLEERRRMQRIRRISDKEILRLLTPYSFELKLFRKYS